MFCGKKLSKIEKRVVEIFEERLLPNLKENTDFIEIIISIMNNISKIELDDIDEYIFNMSEETDSEEIKIKPEFINLPIYVLSGEIYIKTMVPRKNKKEALNLGENINIKYNTEKSRIEIKDKYDSLIHYYPGDKCIKTIKQL